MSDAPHSPEADDDDLLAAEYALGVLDAPARRRVERRMRSDAALLSRIEDWEARLAPMLAETPPVDAPAGVWSGVERDLDRMLRFHASAAAVTPPPDRLVSRVWKWFGLASGGLLAASLALLFVATQPRPGDTPLATLIAPTGGPALYAAVIDASGASATLVPVAALAPADGERELWAIAPNAEPRSLGLLRPDGPVRVVLPPSLVADGYTLAVSLEPPGGSPTGRPTGPVMGTGRLQPI